MMNLTIKQWIEKGKDLPVLSGSIANILSLTDGGESSVFQIADVIKRDISLSAAILRITNSAAFGLLRKVTTIDQAVMLLGFKSIRNIALGVGVFNLFPPQEKDFLSKVWQRSLVTGLAARELCVLIGNKRKEDAFTIGLLHDIGLVAFYGYDKPRASSLLKEIEDNGRMKLMDERNYLGIDHIEVGRLLAEKWRLPEEIILAVTHHHEETLVNATDKYNNEKLFQIIYLASLAGDIFYLGNKTESIKKFTEGCQRLLGISADDTDNLLQNIHPQLMEVAAYFDVAIGSGKTYEEILSKVNEEIVSIAIANEAVKHHLTQAFEREKAMARKLEEANRTLQILASKDPLTGLYNRKFLNELLEKEWSRSQRHGYSLSIIMADIDNFKKVNDEYGHQAGDTALEKIAKIMSENLRDNDCLARYGGEEFLFVLPQTDLKAACKAAERFRQTVRELIIPLDKDQSLSLSISCGVATACPERENENINALIQKADKALYEAKRLGKDGVVACGSKHYSSVSKNQVCKLTDSRYNSIAI
jgi:two-component system, cell cycle response regulator